MITRCVLNFICLQDSTWHRENWTHCIVSCFTIKLYYLKKKNSHISEEFHDWAFLSLSITPASICYLKKKKSQTFCFFFTSPDNSHLCLPYIISFRQGVLASPWLLKWFPRNLSTLQETCHSGRQSRTMLIPLVLSRVNRLSWTFMSY